MTVKTAEVMFVKEIDAEHSGIGRPVPAHVKLLFRDDEGRRNTIFLDLSAAQVEQISRLPDSELASPENTGLTVAQVHELVEWVEENAQNMDMRHMRVYLPAGTITRAIDVFDLFDKLHKMGVKL